MASIPTRTVRSDSGGLTVDSVWPRAALFDLDGTLIDSVPDITLAVA